MVTNPSTNQAQRNFTSKPIQPANTENTHNKFSITWKLSKQVEISNPIGISVHTHTDITLKTTDDVELLIGKE